MKRNNELFNENAVLALHPDYKTEIADVYKRQGSHSQCQTQVNGTDAACPHNGIFF